MQLHEHVLKTLNQQGYTALLVGGCVRDELLGLKPKDYDVATDAIPEQVQAVFPHAQPVGKSFGVMLVPGNENEKPIEVATFRKDGCYSDGRRPDTVEFAKTAEDDSQRRDFTVNALYRDLDGRIYDFHNGKSDLTQGIIRCVGNPYYRLSEDHLRMLRAIRFAVRFAFSIDLDTYGAIVFRAERLDQIAIERVQQELNAMLMGPRPYAAITILRHCRLLRQFLPEVDDLAGLPQPPEFHPEGDVFMHTLLTLERAVGESRTLTLMLACLLHDIGKKPTYEVTDRIRFNGHDKVGAEMAEAILRRLKYSNDVIETVVSHVANHMEFRHVQQMRLARLKRFLALPKFEELLALHRADCLASNGKLDNYEFIRQKQQELPPEVVKPPRLITGDDILALFPGSSPGPWIGEMLAAVEEGQLDGTIKARDEAVALVTDIRFCRFNPEVY